MTLTAVDTIDESWRERVGRWWERFSDYAIVVILLISAGAIAFGVYNGYVAKNSSQSAASLAATAATDTHQLKVYTVHAHNQNVAYQKQIIELQRENRYLLGVTIYLASSVNNSVTEHSGEIQQLQTLTESFASSIAKIPGITAALTGGQDQLLSNQANTTAALNALTVEVAALKTCIATATPAGCA